MEKISRYRRWRAERAYRKEMGKMRSRGVVRAKFAYVYLIAAGVWGFLYGLSCLFHDYPFWLALVPLAAAFIYAALVFVIKNIKMVILFVTSTQRGMLLHVLNQTTIWGYEHKMRVVKWVYPKGETRMETRVKIMNEFSETGEVSPENRKKLRRRSVFCPQQLLDGVNRAILVNALIYAHTNIKPLDDEIRATLELTDENIAAFDFQREINRCKVSSGEKDLARRRAIAEKKLGIKP